MTVTMGTVCDTDSQQQKLNVSSMESQRAVSTLRLVTLPRPISVAEYIASEGIDPAAAAQSRPHFKR